MVIGIDIFKERFRKHADKYVLIGGAACSLLMEDSKLTFRSTKDLDILLIIELVDPDFGSTFWNFIKEGGYINIQKSTGDKEFFRFYEPREKDFPYMLELFSRRPDVLKLPSGSILTPIPIDEDVSSLSAILLNDDYYNFILHGVKTLDSLPVIDKEYLILLKARAYLDLRYRRENNQTVDSKDIRKHRNDIFRLYNLLSPGTRITLPGIINKDFSDFLQLVKAESIDLKELGIRGRSLEVILEDLRKIYLQD